MKEKKKPGRPNTGGRKRNKKLPALFTDQEVNEIREGAKDNGKTQADFVMFKIRKPVDAYKDEHQRYCKCGKALNNG